MAKADDPNFKVTSVTSSVSAEVLIAACTPAARAIKLLTPLFRHACALAHAFTSRTIATA